MECVVILFLWYLLDIGCPTDPTDIFASDVYTHVYTSVYTLVYNLRMSKHIRKLTKTSSHSYLVIIPKEIIEKYGWKERQKLTIEDKGRGKLEIKDWRRK